MCVCVCVCVCFDALGQQGLKTRTGPEGSVGHPGLNGDDGVPGKAGMPGPTGYGGVQGIAGPLGKQGPQGPEGNNGPQGPSGHQGPQGVVGGVGPQGPPGAIGPSAGLMCSQIGGRTYQGVCFKSQKIESNSDAVPDGCDAYNPKESWGESDILAIQTVRLCFSFSPPPHLATIHNMRTLVRANYIFSGGACEYIYILRCIHT